MMSTSRNRAAPRAFSGTVAAGGFAAGPIFADAPEPARTPAPGEADAVRERVRLDAAIAEATLALSDLLDRLEDDEAAEGMVEFQVAMLDDEALVEPAYRAIEEGLEAAAAWRQAMGLALADYETAEDPYFRARASDLADMRERVLRGLEGGGSSRIPAGAIFVGRDLPPSRFLETDWRPPRAPASTAPPCSTARRAP